MSSRSVALALEITSDADNAVSDVDALTAAYRDLTDAEEQASRVAQQAADGNRSAAESADELSSKAGQATGALGALSSGFELVGAEKYAGALQSASLATDFMSGVGDSLNLVMETQWIQTARAKASMVAHKAATIASTVATNAQAVATKALNLVMRANPIGLVITAVLALIAGFTLLYKKSETFRGIVQAVGRAGRAAIGWIVDRVKDAVTWVKDKLTGAFNTAKKLASAAARAVSGAVDGVTSAVKTAVTWTKDKLVGAWNTAKNLGSSAARAVSGAVDGVTSAVKTAVTWTKDKLVGAWNTAQTLVVGYVNAITSPIDTVVSAVKTLVDWIGKIKWPSPPDWLSSIGDTIGNLIPGMEAPTTGTPDATGTVIINPTTTNQTIIQVTGTQLDPYATGRDMARAARRYDLSIGAPA